MAENIRRKLYLTGGREGMTCVVGKAYHFKDGMLEIEGPPSDVEVLTHWFAVNYAAFPEGSKELEASNVQRDTPETSKSGTAPAVLGGDQPGGQGPETVPADNGSPADDAASDRTSDLPEGDGHEDARVHRIKEALTGLDVTNDEHWTNDGKPAVQAVSIILDEQVSRADVDAAAPGFTR